MTPFALRLNPDDDLRASIEKFVADNNISAGCMLTCVGSLKNSVLRLANSENILKQQGPFEIVSLVGTFSKLGCHLHISLSDSEGKMIGGHLLEGNQVFTTAEVVILSLKNYAFSREFDHNTGFEELVINNANEG